MKEKVVKLIRHSIGALLLSSVLAGSSACGGQSATAVPQDPTIVVDTARGEMRVAAVVQNNPDRPVHGRWAPKSTAFVGHADGGEAKEFPILLAADRAELYHAAREELGWRTGRRFTWNQATSLPGYRSKVQFTVETALDQFMTGDPVLCILEFEKDGETVRMALEDAIQCRVKVDGEWVRVPYAPHFVFTGAGEENGIDSGCLYCPSDCVGALFTDNSGPVQTEYQEFLMDWEKLPASGEPLTVIMRSIR